MELRKILSISGRPGLYKVISQAKSSVIVESLDDKKRFPAFEHEKMSSLEEISIFSTGEDMPLKDVFRMMFEKLEQKEAISPKSTNKELQEFFLEMVPEYDQERVYASDIKKIVKWYNMLLTADMLDFSDEEEEEKKKEEEIKDEEKIDEKETGKSDGK